MSTEQNKELVRRYREAHTTNNLALLDTIVAANLVSHTSLPGLPPGLEGGKMAHQVFTSAFPDGVTTTEDLIADGEKVVERFSFRGTNTGPFIGMPPTGKKVVSTGMSIFRIADGKIVEHWGENDALGTFVQLGIVPAPGQ
jgi:predicted ester cyclase